ncbi:tRNA lysidine(34) synthetase TilS [Paenibacillus larvae]
MVLLDKIKQNIHEQNLFQGGDTVVVAVSGGPDSIALLHMLYRLSDEQGWKVIAAHVNHQFRKEESAEEAKYVMSFASGLGIPCEVGVIDVPAYIRETSLNPQVAAREKRYEFLHKIANVYNADKIALAHHADDQAETVLMRIVRGTGLSGLTGIPIKRKEKNVELVRPMLRIYKNEVISYCHEHQLHFFRDSSNDSRKYFRNQVRLDVLPFLSSYNEHLPEALNRLAEMVKGEDDYMDEQARREMSSLVKCQKDSYSFGRTAFLSLHLALQRRVIKLILNYLALQAEKIDFITVEQIRLAILQDAHSNVRLNLPEELLFIREYEAIRIQKETEAARSFSYFVRLEQSSEHISVPESGLQIKFTVEELISNVPDSAYIPFSRDEACFDWDGLNKPLCLRSRKDGDRMEILGLNGSQKVKDMFIDAKIAPSRRDRIPLLTDADDKILWIPGMRRSGHALVTPETKRLLRVKCFHSGDPFIR